MRQPSLHSRAAVEINNAWEIIVGGGQRRLHLSFSSLFTNPRRQRSVDEIAPPLPPFRNLISFLFSFVWKIINTFLPIRRNWRRIFFDWNFRFPFFFFFLRINYENTRNLEMKWKISIFFSIFVYFLYTLIFVQ